MGIADQLRNIASRLAVLHTRWVIEEPLVPNLQQHDLAWLGKHLIAGTPNYGVGRVEVWSLDTTYWLPTQQQMAAIVAWDWTDHKAYLAERYDCEDFAFTFKAHVSEKWQLNNVGLVLDWGSYHSYNVIMFADGSLWWFEPQSDQIVQIGSGSYKCERAEILI